MLVAFVASAGAQVAVSPAYASAPVVAITSCPASIPTRAAGVLQNDVVCTPDETNPFGIELGNDASLDLAGHTITYTQAPGGAGSVLCDNACVVHGPGLLTSSAGGGTGIYVVQRGNLSVHDLDITNMGDGITAPNSPVTATNVSIAATSYGIASPGVTKLDHVDVTLPGDSPSQGCIYANEPNSKVLGHDVTLSGCRFGVWGTTGVSLTRLNVVNSLQNGVISYHGITLVDSTVTGSGEADLSSLSKPHLTNTTCGTSTRLVHHNPAGSWDVCAGD